MARKSIWDYFTLGEEIYPQWRIGNWYDGESAFEYCDTQEAGACVMGTILGALARETGLGDPEDGGYETTLKEAFPFLAERMTPEMYDALPKHGRGPDDWNWAHHFDGEESWAEEGHSARRAWINHNREGQFQVINVAILLNDGPEIHRKQIAKWLGTLETKWYAEHPEQKRPTKQEEWAAYEKAMNVIDPIPAKAEKKEEVLV